MKIHDITQGSPEWHELRAAHFTASEAPAMMGVSKYQTRGDLLRAKATGADRDIDAVTQALFDRGHAAEAAARPMAEKIVGEELYPATVTEEIDGLQLLASLDGMTMAGDTLFEHKLWNEELADDVRCGILKKHYAVQMDQQMLVTGAEKVLFMCSDGTDGRCTWMWYYRNREAEQTVVAGWSQFLADLAAYEHFEDATAPAGKAPETLPALRIELTGMVTASNLNEFKQTALAVIDAVKTDLQTDQDFADADKAVKWCSDVETRIDAAKQHALSQTASIDELFRALDEIKAETRTKRLTLEKLVKSRKESVRVEIQQAAVADLRAHYDQINATLSPCALAFPADFAQTVANAMKGKKTVASLRDAASTAAAHAKIAASQVADRTRANLQAMDEDYRHLFPDLNALATAKAPDDFKAVVALRIQEHKAKIEREAEEARERIRKEEAERVEREAKEKAERERAVQESQTQADEPAEQTTDAVPDPFTPPVSAPPAPAVSAPAPRRVAAPSSKPTRPSDDEIIGTLALKYRVHESKVIEWILDMDLNAASDKMAANL